MKVSLPTNFTEMAADEMAAELRKCLVEVVLPPQINNDNLKETSNQLSYVANLRSYLSLAYVEFDLSTRCLRKCKGPEYEEFMAKKKVIEAYMELLDSLHATLSRMITLYQLELKEIELL